MKHSTHKPPNWSIILENFPEIGKEGLWEKGLIVTYGDTYYSAEDISKDLVVHESTHARQQEVCGGPDVWWNLYFTNPVFRLDQEIEAYKAQFAYFNKEEWAQLTRNDRRYRSHAILEWMAVSLSGPAYGRMITYNKALELLK